MKNPSFSAKWPSTCASSADQSGCVFGHGMIPYQGTQALILSGRCVARTSASPPPMQNPVTPTRSPPARSDTSSTAPAMSLPACSRLIAINSFPASSGSVVVSPRYRSGARAKNPSAAKRSHTSSMWGTSPHHSWMTTRGNPLPVGGSAR